MTILTVPAIVTKIAGLDLSGEVRPIGQDTYKSATAERKAIHARLTELFEADATDTAEFRRLANRMIALNS